MKKPNWVCSNCSMWSSRKSSVKLLYPSSSSAAVNQQQYLSNFQGFGNFGPPYFYPGQSYFEPFHIVPRPEDIFGFEIYVCNNCSSIRPIIISFNEGQEGGSKMGWATCCGSSDLKKLDQKKLNDNNMRQRIHDELKYCVKTWTNNKPMITAIRIPESFRGNSVRLLLGDNQGSISLEYSSKKITELEMHDENYWAPKCIRAGITALSEGDLVDFLGKTENATFAFFTVKVKESKNIYLMAIINDIVNRRLSLV